MAETDVDRAAKLARCQMFAELDEAGLRHVSELATEVTVPAGHVLVQPGHEGSGLFVIAEGTVNVELPGGKRITCEAGEFIGELSLLVEGLVHTGRVRAATQVTCLAVSRADFERLLSTYPQIAVSMLRALARRLAATDAMLSAAR